jgi:hypothetical protein
MEFMFKIYLRNKETYSTPLGKFLFQIYGPIYVLIQIQDCVKIRLTILGQIIGNEIQDN